MSHGVNGHTHRQPRRTHRRPMSTTRKVIGIAALTVVTTLVTLIATTVFYKVAEPATPLAAVLSPLIDDGCEAFVLGAPRLQSMPKRENFGPQWAYAHGGGTFFKDKWELTLQGETDAAVILHSIEVVDLQRDPLPASPGVVSKCSAEGGDFGARYFDIDFSKDRDLISPQAGRNPDTGDVIEPAVSFPYSISRTEAEVFYLSTSGYNCICTYRLAVRWSSGSRSGTLLIDRGFGPLKTGLFDDTQSVPFNVWSKDGAWATY